MDPCLDVTCHYHGLCKAFGPHDARCVCVDSCPSYFEPVCSSNGTTYDNECWFRQQMCLRRLNFTVQHPGSCEGKKSPHIFYCFYLFFKAFSKYYESKHYTPYPCLSYRRFWEGICDHIFNSSGPLLPELIPVSKA